MSFASVIAPRGVVGCTIKQSIGHVAALQQIFALRGGSQAQLMRCSDGRFYAVKFRNNPQSLRVLVNELVAFRLARQLALPVPHCALVHVSSDLVGLTPALSMFLLDARVPFVSGEQFGSSFVGDPSDLRTISSEKSVILSAANRRDAWGVFLFDLWTNNADHREYVVHQGTSFNQLYMIDQGFCFGAYTWSFDKFPRACRVTMPELHFGLHDVSCFEPWLSVLEDPTTSLAIRDIAEIVPREWLVGSELQFYKLLKELDKRRMQVRALLRFIGNENPALFPDWHGQTC